MTHINKDHILDEFAKLQKYFDSCISIQTAVLANAGKPSSTLNSPFIPFESCIFCDHIQLDDILNILYDNLPVLKIINVGAVSCIYAQIIMKAFKRISSNSASAICMTGGWNEMINSVHDFIEAVVHAYAAVPLACAMQFAGTVVRIAEQNSFIASKIASTMAARRLVSDEELVQIWCHLGDFESICIHSESMLMGLVEESVISSVGCNVVCNIIVRVDFSVVNINFNTFKRIISLFTECSDISGAFFFALQVFPQLNADPNYDEMIKKFLSSGSFINKDTCNWENRFHIMLEMALKQFDKISQRFQSSPRNYRLISTDAFQQFTELYQLEFTSFLKANDLSSNFYSLYELLCNPKQIAHATVNFNLATKTLESVFYEFQNGVFLNVQKLIECIDLFCERMFNTGNIIRLSERQIYNFLPSNFAILYYILAINQTILRTVPKVPSIKIELYSQQTIEYFDFSLLMKSFESFGIPISKFLTSFYPDIFDYEFFLLHSYKRKNPFLAKLITDEDLVLLQSKTKINQWWYCQVINDPIHCHKKFVQFVTGLVINQKAYHELLAILLKNVNLSLIKCNNYLIIPLVYCISALFKRGICEISNQFLIHPNSFPTEINYNIAFKDLFHSLLVQNLIKILVQMTDCPFVCDQLCEFLHKHFISYPRILKLVHLQQYPTEMIPLLVERIPSFHLLVNVASVNEMILTAGIEFSGTVVAEVSCKYPTKSAEASCALVLEVISDYVSNEKHPIDLQRYAKFSDIVTKISHAFPHLYLQPDVSANPYGSLLQCISSMFKFNASDNLQESPKLTKLFRIKESIDFRLSQIFEQSNVC